MVEWITAANMTQLCTSPPNGRRTKGIWQKIQDPYKECRSLVKINIVQVHGLLYQISMIFVKYWRSDSIADGRTEGKQIGIRARSEDPEIPFGGMYV